MNRKVKAVLWYLLYLAIAVVLSVVDKAVFPSQWHLLVVLVTSFGCGYFGMWKALEVWTEEE